MSHFSEDDLMPVVKGAHKAFEQDIKLIVSVLELRINQLQAELNELNAVRKKLLNNEVFSSKD